MKLFRKILFWCHLVTGVAVAVVVLIMSVTGVLLTYERQMIAWADTRGLEGGPPAPDAERLDTETLLLRVQETVEGTPTAITWRAEADAPVEVAYGRGRTVFVNAYTGAVLGEGAQGMREFFGVVTDWHRWLAAAGESRATGRAVTGAANLGFLFLVLSGFYLWWPRNWSLRAVRNVTLFRRGLSPKARDFNWHNVIGFWSLIPLFIVVASGVVISYPWASNLVYQIVGEEPPAGRGRGRGGPGAQASAEAPPMDLAGVDALLSRAGERLPGWRSLSLQLPVSADGPVTFAIDRGTGGQPQKRAQLTLDRVTGEEVGWEPFAANTTGRQLRSILRFAHTGEVLGIVGQTIAGIVSLGAAVLVWTGLALSWRRFRSWRRRGARPAPRATHAPARPVRRAVERPVVE